MSTALISSMAPIENVFLPKSAILDRVVDEID